MMSNTTIFAILILLYLLLMWKAGKEYPILYLFVFTYFVQYIFSTHLIYNQYDLLAEQMEISQEEYFGYTVPALIFLFSGVFLFSKNRPGMRELLMRIESRQASALGYWLLFISYFFDLLPVLGISIFDSVISFTTHLKYLAAFCLLFTSRKINYVIIVLIYVQLAIQVLATGVFISFFIWATFLFFFLALKFRFPFLIRVSFIAVAFPMLILIQSVKSDYRKQTWGGEEEGGVELLAEIWEEKSKESADEPFIESEGVIRTVGRLSQGWHLGLTLTHVPTREPFAEGSEMASDIVSSIVPRVFFSEKKTVNSQEKFRKYTGHRLRGKTSMSIGVLGDFYVNYGRWGSFIMLFLFGALIAKLYNFFVKRFVLTDPINIIWIPFILSYLIRANNDFYIFFNGMVKGFLLFLVINYLRYRVLGARKPVRMVSKPSYT